MTQQNVPVHNRELRVGLIVWAILSLLGVGVVALPDDDARIISLSEGHGPSLIDAVGIAVLIAGWGFFVVALWRARTAITRRRLLAALAVTGAGLVVWSVATDNGSWWILGAAILVIAQLLAAFSALRAG